MVTRPKNEIWRGITRTVGHSVGWSESLGLPLGAPIGQRLAKVGRLPRAVWLRFVAAVTVSSTYLTTTLDRLTPGGKSMIFRKDNRGDAFQRSISSLRQQMPSEGEEDDVDYRYEPSDDTSQYPTVGAAREETYAPPRTTDTSATAPVPTTTSTSSTYRSAWQTADSNTSVIAANAHWNGTLRTDGSLHIHGRADGELHAVNDLYVADNAQVDAEIYADNVVVAGTVHGRIQAQSRLEVLPQGHVAGDVKAPKLVVHEGARLTGQLKMESSNGGSSPAPYSTSARKPSKSRRQSQ